MDDLAYAIDVLAERFGLTPAGGRGQYAISFDWDMSLIESSEQTFAQMSELQAGGMVSKAEMRRWVMGGTIEESEDAIKQIAAEDGAGGQSALERILAGGGGDGA